MRKRLKYIFVVGGVMSGVGKGITVSSIARILSSRGLRVTAVKIDPYVNVDAGTLNPTEHGEVFVLDDGLECDQDMGNYERFLNTDLPRDNYMTTGSVYLSVIEKERNLEYEGRNVEVVPDIPREVIRRIDAAAEKAGADIVITEVGGTVGEYQNILFLEAARMVRSERPGDAVIVMVSYLPVPGSLGEMKTKPTQYASRSLNAAGLQADIIIARANEEVDSKRKQKIATFCSVREEDVISAPDVESIYDVPLNFEKDGLSENILWRLSLRPKRKDLKEWRAFVKKIHGAKKTVRIGIVGKYFGTGNYVLTDSYISVIEAVKHAAFDLSHRPSIEWLDAEMFEKKDMTADAVYEALRGYDGLIVPGGFGTRGVEGKIRAIECARTHGIPYLGLCYGMQLAVVEYARHVLGLAGAHTTEVASDTPHPVIDIMPEQKALMEKKNYGATMRLGAYPCTLAPNSIAFHSYNLQPTTYNLIHERHRHRFEVNPDYIARLEAAGLVFSGRSPDGVLMEIAELPLAVHPFFLGTQFHPELKSRPLAPHPLFLAFIRAAIDRKT